MTAGLPGAASTCHKQRYIVDTVYRSSARHVQTLTAIRSGCLVYCMHLVCSFVSIRYTCLRYST